MEPALTESPDMADRPVQAAGRSRAGTIRLAAATILGVAVLALVAQWMLPSRVEGTPVVRQDVARWLVLTGRVRPPARPLVGATVGGTVREVAVREGDSVR